MLEVELSKNIQGILFNCLDRGEKHKKVHETVNEMYYKLDLDLVNILLSVEYVSLAMPVHGEYPQGVVRSKKIRGNNNNKKKTKKL